jgi:predicted nucleic acid-binding protein
MILLLDNTVLSNFALVNKLELLPKALGSQVATTRQVIHEYQEGVAKGLLPEARWDWLKTVDLEIDELALFQDHLKRVNAGEAACLAVAARRKGRILTDDRDARKLAAQLKVPVSGTLGILLRLVQIEALTLPEANQILGEMIRKGYRSPVDKLDDL